MAHDKKNPSNDFTGGRDSLGPVHLTSEEEDREAAMRLAVAMRRWAKKNRRTKARQEFALEEVLLMTGIKKEPSKLFDVKYTLRELSRKSKQWFGERSQ